jgi:hypothetical protein
MPKLPDNRRVNGPPEPPIRIIAVGVFLLVIIAMLAGCVRAREAAYYAPPKPVVCEIPVYDGPREQGKVIKCLTRAEWSAP